MIVVSDTTPISNFLQINRLALLRQLYEKVIVPPSVFSELLVLSEFGVSLSPIIEADWIETQSPFDTSLVNKLLEKIDIGEAEAIALAVETKPDHLLIDEKQGREIAEHLNLPIIGTIGILLKAKQAGIIEKVGPELVNLLSIGFWINSNLYQRILKLAEEEV